MKFQMRSGLRSISSTAFGPSPRGGQKTVASTRSRCQIQHAQFSNRSRIFTAARSFLHGGISFGGVLAFILADLIVLPILNIYRKYYGLKMAAFLLVTFYIAMACAALVVEGLFGVLGLIPREHQARVVEATVTWNYTTWLNIGFLFLAH